MFYDSDKYDYFYSFHILLLGSPVSTERVDHARTQEQHHYLTHTEHNLSSDCGPAIWSRRNAQP